MSSWRLLTNPRFTVNLLSQLRRFHFRFAPALTKPVTVMLLLLPLLQLGEEFASEKLSLNSAPYSQTFALIESCLIFLSAGFSSSNKETNESSAANNMNAKIRRNEC